MNQCQTIWILPHRDQSGDEDVVKDGRPMKLTAAVPLEKLPKELVLGIPESVLQQHPDPGLIFAQYVRQSDRAFFSLSVTCGKDVDGRTVYLTVVEILGAEDEPHLRPSVAGLPNSERPKAERLLARIGDIKNKWGRQLSEMLKAAKANRGISSFSSVAIPDAAYPPQWTPEKKKLRRLRFR